MPSDVKPLVFISSTSDLAEERASVADAMPRSVETYRYEEDTARRQAPRDRLKKILASTDVFVGILGGRYGSPYPDCSEDRSIVEWEFDTAKAREETEILAFLKGNLQPEDIEPEQQTFIEKLTGFTEGLWVKPFDTPSHLQAEVGEAMADWALGYWSKYHEALDELEKTSWVSRWSAPALVAIVGGVLAAGVHIGWPKEILVGLCLLLVVPILGMMILTDR